MVEQEVLLGLRDLPAAPLHELVLEGVHDGGGRAGAIDEHEAEQAARVRETAACQYVGARTLTQPHRILHVQEVQHSDQIFSQRLQRGELVPGQ